MFRGRGVAPRLLSRFTFSSLSKDEADRLVRSNSGTDAAAACNSYRAAMKAPGPAILQSAAILSYLRGTDHTAARTIAIPSPDALTYAANALEESYIASALPFFQAMTSDFPSPATHEALLCIVKRLPKDHEARIAAVDEALSSCQKDHRLAPLLLGPICQCLPAERHADGQHLLDLAMHAPSDLYVNAEAFADVLDLALRAEDWQQVNLLWGWMQQTRAAYNSRAVSCVIIARCRLQLPTRSVIADVQALARAGADPSPQAQLAVIEFLGSKTRPPVSLAEELVAAWTPAPSASHGFALITSLASLCHKGGAGQKAVEKLLTLEPQLWAAADEARLRQVVVYVANHVSDLVQRKTIAKKLVQGLAQLSRRPPAETVGMTLVAIALLEEGDALIAELNTWAGSLSPSVDGDYVKLACRSLLPLMASGNLERASSTVKALCSALGVPVPEEFESWTSLLNGSAE